MSQGNRLFFARHTSALPRNDVDQIHQLTFHEHPEESGNVEVVQQRHDEYTHHGGVPTEVQL